jgi:hypothetical protein
MTGPAPGFMFGSMADEPESLLQHRIRLRMKALQTNPFRAASENGLKPDTIRNILRPGKATNPRQDTLIDLARALKCSVAYLTGETDSLGDAPAAAAIPLRNYDPYPLVVRHSVAAGVWREVDELRQVEPELSPLRSSPNWPSNVQWVDHVVGDSMNEVYPDGSYVRVVSIFAIRGYQPVEGDHVEVLRRRDGGMLLERTLKEIRYTKDGKIELWARSTNPKWAEPIPYHDGIKPDDEEAEVRIEGLVTGDFRDRSPRR